MTTLTATSNFSGTAAGPTPGTLRAAASVNAPVQTVLDNTLGIANGYAKTRQLVVTTANTASSVSEQFVRYTASGSAVTTKAQTIDFTNPGTDYTNHWKFVYFERLDQGTVVTFKANGTTFLTFTSDAYYRGLQLHFRGENVASWSLAASTYEGTSVYVADYASSVTDISVTGNPREVRAYISTGASINTVRLDLDGTYYRGDRLTVHVYSLLAVGTFTIRDDSDNTIIALGGRQDGGNMTTELVYDDSGWSVLGVTPDNRGIVRSLTIAAITQAVASGTYEYFLITTPISSAITLTLADGSFDGQKVHIMADQILLGGSMSIVYTGPVASSGFTIAATAATNALPRSFSAVWIGTRWHVLGYSLEI